MTTTPSHLGGHDDKFYVYSPNHGRQKSACQYYRIDVPLEWLQRLGYAKTWNDKGDSVPEIQIEAMLTSEVNLFYSMHGEDFLHRLKVIREMNPGFKPDGSLIIPPVAVVDWDDNTDYIHPYNWTYGRNGFRTYPEGEILKPGEGIVTVDEDGNEKILWMDRVTRDHEGILFDVARNLRQMKYRHECIRTAHGATATTKVLANYFRDVCGQKNTYVFPNTVVPEDYPEYPLVPKDEIRILWQGGASHAIDWFPLRDSIREVCRRYPKVKWVVYGELFTWLREAIPADQIELIPWDDYAAYKLRRGLLQIDINLCPLADNAFNRCKSAIKWYEGSIWSKPEATLAQATGPYKAEMVDGETGLLFSTPEEFVEKLSILIENADLRKRLGHNARQWVLDNRTPEKTVPGLFEFYKELREQRAHAARALLKR